MATSDRPSGPCPGPFGPDPFGRPFGRPMELWPDWPAHLALARLAGTFGSGPFGGPIWPWPIWPWPGLALARLANCSGPLGVRCSGSEFPKMCSKTHFPYLRVSIFWSQIYQKCSHKKNICPDPRVSFHFFVWVFYTGFALLP